MIDLNFLKLKANFISYIQKIEEIGFENLTDELIELYFNEYIKNVFPDDIAQLIYEYTKAAKDLYQYHDKEVRNLIMQFVELSKQINTLVQSDPEFANIYIRYMQYARGFQDLVMLLFYVTQNNSSNNLIQ